jgi:hypothetical protein
MLPLQLTNQRFGRLVVKEPVDIGCGLKWRATCDCGGEKIARGADLKAGRTKSCGCLLIDEPKSRATHNLSNTRFYRIWVAMRQRCNNPKASRYYLYGERGITVCPEWEIFENFQADMYESYLDHVREFGIKNTSLDRKKNELNYCPENCRWATQKEQVNNSSKVLNSKKRRQQNEQ